MYDSNLVTKRLWLLVLPLLLLAFSACSNSDDEKHSYDRTKFYGEWCTIDDVGTATCITYGEQGLSGSVYTDLATVPKLSERVSGMWNLYQENSVLRMSIFHESTGDQTTEDYTVMQLSGYVLQMRSLSYGSVEVYNRVVATHAMKVGDTLQLNMGDMGVTGVTGYATTNADVVSVDANGHLTATGGGVAFVSIFTGQGTVLLKVEAASRVKHFAEDLTRSIDEVLSAYGKPDNQVQMGVNMAIIYQQSSFDEALSAIQYQYDEQTREVTRVLTLYGDTEAYMVDKDYILANYFSQGKNMYGDHREFLDCKVILLPFESDGAYYVSYGNQAYHNVHDHY